MNIPLKGIRNQKIRNNKDIYLIMQRILLRQSRTDRNREHLWVISLGTGLRLLNIELVSIGSVKATIAEPMEVFSIPLQKRALKILVVHNHPSGELVPSLRDKDITDQLIQCGLILNVPVLDHLIISETGYFSFLEFGLMEELSFSLKYVPAFKAEDRIKEIKNVIGQQKSIEMAKMMKQNGEPVEKIMRYTGLSKSSIGRIKTD